MDHCPRSSGCTDPHDRIYALLSLIDKNEAKQLRPGYRKPFPELVLEVAKVLRQSPYWDEWRDSDKTPQNHSTTLKQALHYGNPKVIHALLCKCEQLADESESSDSETETDVDGDADDAFPERLLSPNNVSSIQWPHAEGVRAPPTCSSCHQQGHPRSSRFCPDSNNLQRHRDVDDAVGNHTPGLSPTDTQVDFRREFHGLREDHARLDEQMDFPRHLHSQKMAEVGSSFVRE